MSRRILLVEDDQGLGATLAERLQKAGYLATWVDSLSKAEQALQGEGVDLIILDVGLPDGSGFDFARRLRSRFAVPFIFCTARATAEDRLEGYDIGALEFIPKPFHLREFMLRVEHALASHTLPQELRFGEVVIDVASMSISREGGHKERFAARDFRLLQLLIERSPQVISRDEILNQLWGEDRFPSTRTVDNAVVRLRQALGEKVGAYLKSVRSVGYQWDTQGGPRE
ncbi:MAG: response regulator transcription factor [Bdellovibrionales bacterium]